MLFKELEEKAAQHPEVKLPKHVRMLVTGLPRGGTWFVSDALSKAGIPTGHETFFGQHGQRNFIREDWKPVASVSGFMYPWVPYLAAAPSDEQIPIYHLIRHPVQQISSILNYFGIYRSPDDWTIKSVELTWLRAHRRNALWSLGTYRMEDMERTVKELAKRYCEHTRSNPLRDVDAALKTATRGSSTPTPRISWGELEPETKEFATRFDYGP